MKHLNFRKKKIRVIWPLHLQKLNDVSFVKIGPVFCWLPSSFHFNNLKISYSIYKFFINQKVILHNRSHDLAPFNSFFLADAWLLSLFGIVCYYKTNIHSNQGSWYSTLDFQLYISTTLRYFSQLHFTCYNNLGAVNLGIVFGCERRDRIRPGFH